MFLFMNGLTHFKLESCAIKTIIQPWYKCILILKKKILLKIAFKVTLNL